MTDMKYGRRNVAKMIREWDALRQAIRGEGTPAIQTALDQVEEHIDYAYRAIPAQVDYFEGIEEGIRIGWGEPQPAPRDEVIARLVEAVAAYKNASEVEMLIPKDRGGTWWPKGSAIARTLKRKGEMFTALAAAKAVQK